MRRGPPQACPNRRAPTADQAPPGIEERRARPRAVPLLLWYYRTKYRLFAREERPRPPQRGPTMLELDALAQSGLRRALQLGLLPDIAPRLPEVLAARRW